MAGLQHENLTESLRLALRKPAGAGGDSGMFVALRGQHPADIAESLEDMAPAEALAVFNWLDNPRAAEVLHELDPDIANYIIEHAPPMRIADLLERLPMDDAAELVSDTDPETREELLAGLSASAPEDAAEIRELLSYAEGTAGRLMSDKYIGLTPDMYTEEALMAVRNADIDVETLAALYVVEPNHGGLPVEERLIGVLPLRDLLRAKPHKKVANIMKREPIAVNVDTDQEEVARIISKYDFVALPVLDHQGLMAGIVTVDDVLDIMEEEQTEDVLALGAVSASDQAYSRSSVLETVRQRFGWLLLLFVAETATGTVLRHFEAEIATITALAWFIPLLIGTGGNAGAQAVTTITRAIALNEIRFKDIFRVLNRELQTGLVLGAALGITGFVRALLWHSGWQISMIVGITMIVVVIWAVVVGSMLPLIFRRLNLDPAVMSAPFITTLVDATGLFFYFTIAKIIVTRWPLPH